MSETISAEDISMTTGILLSVILSYVPGLNTRFAALHPTYKRLIMLLLLVIVAVIAYLLGCIGQSNIECSKAGAWGLGRVLAAAIIANQSAYAVTPRTEAVQKEASLAPYSKLHHVQLRRS